MFSTPPEIKRVGDSVFALWTQGKVYMEFSRFTESKDTLSAELAVTNDALALHWSRINLASATGRREVIRSLDETQPDMPWRSMLDRACQEVARTLRVLEPPSPLVATPPSPDRWMVEPWVPLGEITILFGDGGAAKSLFALALAVSGILGHPVGGTVRVSKVARALYLDWETDRQTHAERLWGLTSHLEELPADAILHRRLYRPVAEDIATIRGDCDRHHIDFVICDSLGAACGPEPESASAAIAALMALRSLTATKLVIAHVSKAAAEQTKARPFGSVYVQNIARSTIEARREEAADDAAQTVVSYYHRKSNNGRLAKSFALEYEFDDASRIFVTKAEPDMASASLSSQIINVLLHGHKTGTQIAEDLGANQESVRRTLSRLEKRDKVVRQTGTLGGRGKETLWGLRDRNRDIEPF